MKSTLVLVFCFLWVSVFSEKNQKPIGSNEPKVVLIKTCNDGLFNTGDILAPEVLTQYTISGTVKHAVTLTPFVGVTMTCSNGTSDITDNLGQYSLLVDKSDTVTMTPSYNGVTFSPESKSYIKVTQNYLTEDYVEVPIEMITINGTITDGISDLRVQNHTIDFGNGLSATTNSQGQYTVSVLPNASYTLTPTSSDYNFVPISRSYPDLTTDIFDQDYNGIPVSSLVLPAEWAYNANTGVIPDNISVFVSANPNICGTPIQSGDLIGVFYVGSDGLQHCGGVGEWTGIYNTSIIAVGDDPDTPVKDGFAYNEILNFRIYSNSLTSHEYPAYPPLLYGQPPKWAPLGGLIVTSLPAYKSHNISIPLGWSGISSYILPRTGTVACTTVMAPILSKLVILQNLTKTYWPSQNTNTIGNWNPLSGYKIKVTEAVTLPIIGCDYSPKTLSLVTGWNLIPVLSDCNVLLESLFAANLNKITLVKEVSGSNIYWPAVNIKTLLVLQPGKAYLMKVTANFSVTFPACTSFKDEETANTVFINNTPWNDPVMTPSNHSIALPTGIMDKLLVGDVIGVFTQDGFCAGLVQVNDISENVLLQVFGDDPTTPEKDGCLENENLNFKLFRAQLKQEFEIALDFDASFPSSDGHFATDGLSVASKIVFNPTFIHETGNSSISFYPNPSNGLVEFVAGDSNRKFNITIFDLTGQKTCETCFSAKTQINLSTAPKGIYIVKIESNNIVRIEKLVIQ